MELDEHVDAVSLYIRMAFSRRGWELALVRRLAQRASQLDLTAADTKNLNQNITTAIFTHSSAPISNPYPTPLLTTPPHQNLHHPLPFSTLTLSASCLSLLNLSSSALSRACFAA